MTVYKVDCWKCTQTAIGTNGYTYCQPMREGRGGVYIEPGHAGTKLDPDPIMCDHYTTEPRQMVLLEIE